MKRILSLLLGVMIAASMFIFPTSFAAEDAPAEGLHVPQIRVVTKDNVGLTLQKVDGYVEASVEITDTDGSVVSDDVLFKVRGNGTALEKILKKAYTFKFEKKRDVLGLGKGKKWALLANAMDVSLLRNYIAIDFAQQMGLPYTSDQRMVEVWLDGSFRGLYTLIEPVQEGKERVNIDIESNEGKKDFLLQLEKSRSEEGVSYVKIEDIRFEIKEPEEPTADQITYIKGVMTPLLKTIRTGTEEQIRAVVDIDSFAKFYILNEYVKTTDFDFSSVFFFYQDGKLYAGPPWDYDHAMGSGGDVAAGNYQRAAETEGVYAGTMHFYRYLCGYDWFMDEVKTIYADNRDYITDIAADGGLIDRLAEEYSAEITRNFTLTEWPVTKQWSIYQRKPLPTYQENLDFLKDWCRARGTWLEGYLYEEPAHAGWYIGDADTDGSVTVLDATAIQRVLARFHVQAFNEKAADVTGNGLDILDATAIQRKLVNFADPYHIGEFTPEPTDEA